MPTVNTLKCCRTLLLDTAVIDRCLLCRLRQSSTVGTGIHYVNTSLEIDFEIRVVSSQQPLQSVIYGPYCSAQQHYGAFYIVNKL